MIKRPLSTYSIIFLCTLPLLFIQKGSVVKQVNLFNYPDLFNFFKVVTFFGDGLFLALCLIFFMFFRKKLNLFSKKSLYEILLASLLMFVLVSVLKNVFFFEIYRPVKFFTDLPQEWNFEAYDMAFHSYRSFPSGHSATIGVLGFFLIEHLSNKFLQLVTFLLMLLVGFSRIFLFQHFTMDVICGLTLGLACVIFSKMLLKIKFKKVKRKHKYKPFYKG